MKMRNLVYRQQGMTLVEVLIAMVLGIFLLTGVIQIFLGSQQNYRLQENLSRMQENGRFAIGFLAQDLRMAGFQGCIVDKANNIIEPASPNPNPRPLTLPSGDNLMIVGSDNVANNWNAIACGGADACIAGTDAISFHFGQYCANLIGNMATDNANIQIPSGSPCNIKKYDVLLVSDCSNADIFIATNASSGLGKQTIAHATNQNTGPKLGTVYGPDAEIHKLMAATFFIRSGASGIASLWKMDNVLPSGASNPIELIEGIENMQILYGADTNGDETPEYYVPAGTAGLDMNTVVSVRITVLVASLDDNVTTQSRDYIYNGVTTTPTDRRLRRVFSSTFAVRNRLS